MKNKLSISQDDINYFCANPEWVCQNYEGTTLKQLAEQQGITYEAIRKQFSRYNSIPEYAHLFGEHIKRPYKSKTLYLDDILANFLNDRRKTQSQSPDNKIIREKLAQLIEEMEVLSSHMQFLNTEKLEKLSEENGTLKAEINHLENENASLKAKLQKCSTSYEELLKKYNDLNTSYNMQIRLLETRMETMMETTQNVVQYFTKPAQQKFPSDTEQSD